MKWMSFFRRSCQKNSFVELTEEEINCVGGGAPSFRLGEGILTAFKIGFDTSEGPDQYQSVKAVLNDTPAAAPGILPNLTGTPPGRGKLTAGRIGAG